MESSKITKKAKKTQFHLLIHLLPKIWSLKQEVTLTYSYSLFCLMGHLQEYRLFYSFAKGRFDIKVCILKYPFFLVPQKICCIVLKAFRNIQRLFVVKSLMNYWQEFISTVPNCLLKSASLNLVCLFSITPPLHFSISNRS